MKQLTNQYVRGTLEVVANESPTAHEGGEKDRDRGRGENAIFDALRRLVGSGVERIAEGPENLKHLVSEFRLPRELLSAVGDQIDDAKLEALRLVLRETKQYLASRDLAGDLLRLLTGLTLEVKTQIRLLPNPASGEKLAPLAAPEKNPRSMVDSSIPPRQDTASPDEKDQPPSHTPVVASAASEEEKES